MNQISLSQLQFFLLLIIFFVIVVLIAQYGMGEENDEEEERAPIFNSYVDGGDHPMYFYAGLQDQMNLTVKFYNYDPGNITVNVTWDPVQGFSLIPHGNITVVIPGPTNDSMSFGKTVLNFTLFEDTITPGHAPYQNNLTFTATAVKWESDLPPDPMERTFILELRYEELNPMYEIDDIPKHKILTEFFTPPFHIDHNYLRITNLGNADLRFESQISVDTRSDGMCTVLYLNSNKNITEYPVFHTFAHQIPFDFEFSTETLPATFVITIRLIPTVMSDEESIRSIPLETRIFNVTYEFDYFSKPYFAGLNNVETVHRGESVKHTIIVKNNGNSREFFTLSLIGLDDTSNASYKTVSLPEDFWLDPGEEVSYITELKMDTNVRYGYTIVNVRYMVEGSHGSNDTWEPIIVIYREEPFDPAKELGQEIADEIGTVGYVIGYSLCYGVPILLTYFFVTRWSKKQLGKGN